MRRCACIVERCEDARWALAFDKIANNLVVEVLDGCPLDLFTNVFLLLRLQCQFNEDLLKLLVHVVDAQLLERVVVAVRTKNEGSLVDLTMRRLNLTYKISKP